MTIHCARCRKTLVSGTIVAAHMQKVTYDEVTETASTGGVDTTTVYYCEECMRSVH
jgi:hypothetical protein